jgi:enterobactin synthetase component D
VRAIILEKCFEFCSFLYNPKKDYSKLGLSVLSKNELENSKKCVLKRRNELIFGKLCAKKCFSILAEKNFEPTSSEILKTKFGAPFFPDGNYGVSISHDSEIAAAVVFKKSEIDTAIDVQKICSENSKVIYKFVNDSEKALIDNTAETFGFDFSCGAVWAAKESLSKLFGFGFSIFSVLQVSKIYALQDMNDVCVEFEQLKNFAVIIKKYSDYVFAFASDKKTVENFFEENFSLRVTEFT